MLGTRSRIAIAAAMLSGGALLAPAAPAAALKTDCGTFTYCDTLIVYYSDSTKTYVVGEYENGPCGQVNWGQKTSYLERIHRTC